MALELRHLRYFVAVAEEGHISRAAERLGIQQPPLSQQIKSLERELDVQLLRRKARGVEMTDAGRALLADARNILARVERAIETVRRTARGDEGHVRLGVAPTAPFHPFVPRVIRSFREAFPAVSLNIEESLTNDLIEHLRNESIDAAFIRTPPDDPGGLTIAPLLVESMMIALPSNHVLAGSSGSEAAIKMDSLAGETFIVYGRRLGQGLYDATIAACHAAGFTPRLGQEAPRIASTLNLVAAGLGISLVPASLQRMHVDGVEYRPINGPIQPKAMLSLASRRTESSAAVRQFLNLVKHAAAESHLERD